MHTILSEIDGHAAGFANFGPSRDEPGCGELYMIYVAPESWSRGCGRALIGEVQRVLNDDGFAEAILWVLEDNPRTRRFYELSGWRVDGGVKDEEWLETEVREVRYRVELGTSH